MTTPITSLGWPAALDVLAWSADSELAVAVGEVVDVLIPKLQIDLPAADAESARWHRVRLVINTFTEKELPLLQALSSTAITTRNAQAKDQEPTTHHVAVPDRGQHPKAAPVTLDTSWVAEEQSLSNAISLAWSPPGLAKYNRCALAILTGNWVLSVWATVSRPKEQTGWRRVLTVNAMLREYFRNAPSSTEQSKSSSDGDVWRRRARLKAFTWAPARCRMLEDDNVRTCQEDYLLAANDLNELIILRITKHTARNTFAADGTLMCSVDSVTPIDDASNELARGEVLAVASQITHVAWSAWTCDENDICTSKIAYIYKDELRVRNCIMSRVKRIWNLKLEDGEITAGGHHKGPLNWSSSVRSMPPLKKNPIDRHNVLQTTHLNLVSITNDGPLCQSFELASKGKSPIVSQAPDLLHWHNVSGIGITSRPDGQQSLHYAAHMWYADDGPIAGPLELPFMTGASPHDRSWRTTMMKDILRFGVENKIDSRVLARVWGLGASPLNDHVAVCYSLHPSDMVQYAMASEQEYHLLATVESDHLPDVQEIETKSAETMLFSIRRWLERREPLSNTDFEELQTWTLVIVKQRDLKCSNSSRIKLKQQINTKSSFALHVLDTVRNANRHLEQTSGCDNIARALELSIALSTGILTLSCQYYDKSEISRQIVSNHQNTLHLMAERGAAIDGALLSGTVAAGDNHETCEICSAAIPFEDNTWARCEHGHQFGQFQSHIVAHPC